MVKIIRANEPLQIDPPIIYLVGAKSRGKTSAACSANNPILIDIEGGAHRSMNRVDAIPCKTKADVLAALKLTDGYDTVVIDSASRLSELCFIAAKGKGKVSQFTYGETKRHYQEVMMALPRNKPVIIIGHLKVSIIGQGDNATVEYAIEARGNGVKEHMEQHSDAVGQAVLSDDGRYGVAFNGGGVRANPCELPNFNMTHGKGNTMQTIIDAYMENITKRANANVVTSVEPQSNKTLPDTDDSDDAPVSDELPERIQGFKDMRIAKPENADLLDKQAAQQGYVWDKVESTYVLE